MMKYVSLFSLIVLASSQAFAAEQSQSQTLVVTGIGEVPTEAQINAWDIDVRPDGKGLPRGSSTAEIGEPIYAEKCAICHGDFGEGVGRWPVLTGGHGSLTSESPEKTVGSYWPYTSTLFDYIYRAMPFGEARTLTPDEVYGIAAYILAENDVIDYDFEVNQDNFAQIELPNQNGFFADDRSKTEVNNERCMTDCAQDVGIQSLARILDVTPETGGAGNID